MARSVVDDWRTTMNVSESVSTVILFLGAVTFGLVVGSCRGIFSNVLEAGASTFAPPRGGRRH